MENIPLKIFDKDLNFITEIDDYEYLRIRHRWRTCDFFEISANRHLNNVEELQKGRVIAVKRYGEWIGAKIEKKEILLTEEGKASENYNICGRGLDFMTQNRRALHNIDFGSGYDIQSGESETLMRHFVNVNMINASDPLRNYPLLELATDQGRGPVFIYRARFEKIEEILETISLFSGLGWGIVMDITDKKYIFKVYQGVDRSQTAGVDSPVIFRPDFDNLRLLSFTEDSIESRNVLYIAGQGEAADRKVLELSYNDEEYSGWDRAEEFQDARDIDEESIDELEARGRATLADLAEITIFEIENLEAGPFEYGKDFYKGDIVKVQYPEVAEIDTRVIGMDEEITGDIITQKLIIGKEYPDIKRFIKRLVTEGIKNI